MSSSTCSGHVSPPLEYQSTLSVQHRLAESLHYGAVPVLFSTHFPLPFSELIDWSRIAVQVPLNSITNVKVS